jgi:hypothetical protein
MKRLSVFSLLFLLTGIRAPARPQGGDSPIWNGVFTAEQADRGKANFTTSCVRCHGQNLAGGTGPSLTGQRFMSSWENENVYRLFVKIRDTMPPNFGTALTDEAKLDVVSYILQANGFPAGGQELRIDSDALESIPIVRKAAPVSAAAPANFSIVRVVGCLSHGANNAWILTNTTDPVAAKDEPSTPTALKQAEAQALGTGTFRLVSATRFKPDLHDGHKVEAKGLLYREANDPRLNLTSLEMVSPNCGH